MFVCLCVCPLQSKLIKAYKMTPETSKGVLIVFITIYQMDPVTEYTGQVQCCVHGVFSHIYNSYGRNGLV